MRGTSYWQKIEILKSTCLLPLTAATGCCSLTTSLDSLCLFKSSTTSTSAVLANCLFFTEEKTWFIDRDAAVGGKQNREHVEVL